MRSYFSLQTPVMRTTTVDHDRARVVNISSEFPLRVCDLSHVDTFLIFILWFWCLEPHKIANALNSNNNMFSPITGGCSEGLGVV